MLNDELNDKIRHTLAAGDAHNARMKSALTKLSTIFPARFWMSSIGSNSLALSILPKNGSN
jgi:hypothetical protein